MVYFPAGAPTQIGVEKKEVRMGKNQPTKKQLRQRLITVKKALIEADTKGMVLAAIPAAVQVAEPMVTTHAVSMWVPQNERKLQAERSTRRIAGRNYVWFHRGVNRKSPQVVGRAEPPMRVRRVPTPTQSRVITISLPSLPRITRLRVYAFAVTVYAILITLAL